MIVIVNSIDDGIASHVYYDVTLACLHVSGALELCQRITGARGAGVQTRVAVTHWVRVRVSTVLWLLITFPFLQQCPG